MNNEDKQSDGSKDFDATGKPADVSRDDSHKVEKLAKAGRDDLDTEAGSD